jgi:cell division septation protein DedD/nucleoid DNA-binding protein
MSGFLSKLIASRDVLLILHYKTVNMNLGKYIQTLLPEHDTVIIPGFGAFISEYKPAQINEKTGEMSPPSSHVRFDPNIRFNDGLLAGHISIVEDISIAQANRMIDTEREEIYYRLDKGETVTIDNLGILFFNADRQIQFNHTGQDNLLMDAFGLGTTLLVDEPEPVEEAIPAEDIPEETSEVGEVTPRHDEPFTEPEPVAYTRASLRNPGDVRVRRKRNKAWWLLLFLIPLIGGGIYILLQKPEVKPAPVQVRVEEPAPVPQVVAPADTATATEAVPENVDEDTADIIEIIRPNPSTFYLIRGSYEDMENAHKHLHQLRQKGYHPFHLGQHGSFFLIGIDSFSNKTQAFGEQYNYLDKFPDSGVWIFNPDSI